MQLYSHSRLSTYENCAKQFKFKYVDKIQVESEGIEAFLGKRVHEILERLYHHVARYGRPPSLYKVHQRFQKDWEHHWHEHVHIVKTENDVEHYQDVGLRCLSNYYRSHYPFDAGETVGIELPLVLDLDREGRFRIRGIVDRIVRQPNGHYEIHDYKTGGWVPPKARIEKDRQLALYQIGLEQTYPDVKSVELVWHYVQFNRTIKSERTPEQLETLRAQTISLIEAIESTSSYPATTGPLCRWCEYRTICNEGQAHVEKLVQDSGAPPGEDPPPEGIADPPEVRFKRGAQLSLWD